MDNRHRIQTLKEVLSACAHQIQYFQSQPRFACDENVNAHANLLNAIDYLFEDLDEASDFVDRAIKQLNARRDRREQAGTLGTHQGEDA